MYVFTSANQATYVHLAITYLFLGKKKPLVATVIIIVNQLLYPIELQPIVILLLVHVILLWVAFVSTIVIVKH